MARSTLHQYVALLRAVNVGGRKVKMDALRQVFVALGFSNVETFIASGNVLFQSAETNGDLLERKIEGLLRESFGFDVKTFVRTAEELTEVASYQSFPHSEIHAEGNSLYISFLPRAPSEGVATKLAGLRTEFDEFHVHNREIYWLCRTNISDSKVSGATLERAAGMPSTSRKSTTVHKLVAKFTG